MVTGRGARAQPAVMGGARPIVKIAYTVTDAAASAAHWFEAVGAGPFFVKSHIPVMTADSGAVFDHSSAFGRWGDVMVELMQIHAVEPESTAEVLMTLGVHHVTWFADSLEGESRRLEAFGWPVVLTATTAGGVTFQFHDARHDLGHLVEIYEQSPGVVAHYAMVEDAARGWDGQDPVRIV
jgi:Glyoxalase/Bleomycin resistance protein/Dioxygenase superfamily